ncbi:HNH endonuclease, partial [Mycolicibacterium goodii]|nr:HNH endonuclease [Mycolicibacterium goodii]
MFESVFDIDPQASEADLRDQIEHLERLKSAAAAAQARAAVLWDRKRRAAEAAVGVAAARRG